MKIDVSGTIKPTSVTSVSAHVRGDDAVSSTVVIDEDLGAGRETFGALHVANVTLWFDPEDLDVAKAAHRELGVIIAALENLEKPR